jgi:hypothetical protein
LPRHPLRLLPALALPLAWSAWLDPALAQQEEDVISANIAELVTDRPDVTESTTIVPTGWIQLELGGTREEEGAARTLAGPATLMRVGLLPRVEARLAWDGYQDVQDAEPGVLGPGICCDASGVADGEASLKILVAERRRWRPDVALLPSLTLPFGRRPFTNEHADPGLKALLANDFSSRLSWGMNLGATWISRLTDSSRVRVISWSYSLGLDLGPRLGGFLELFGEDQEGEPAAHSFDGGFTFQTSPNVQLDASASVGLSSAAPDWSLGAGLAFRLPVR